MLILTRRIGETLRIGDDVSLTVLGVQGNQVRIGADAPKEVAIHREEIYRRIQKEKNSGTSDYQPKTTAASVRTSEQNNIDSLPTDSQAYSYSTVQDGDYATAQKKTAPTKVIFRKSKLSLKKQNAG